MEYNKLPGTDIDVSKICLGTMTWGRQNSESEAFEQMDYSLDKGVNFFDTAELYPVPATPDRYVRKVKLNAKNFIIGTFSTLGPKKCSGLDITQYDESSLKKLFVDKKISFNKSESINHITPFETTQNFIFCSFSSKK